MLILVFLVIIPAYIGFKRGHNGYAMGSICLAAFIFSFLIGLLFKNNAVYLGLFFLSWTMINIYCLLVKGDNGDQLDIKGKTINITEESEGDVSISEDDFVLLKTYTESWRQSELMDDIQKLTDAKIIYQSKSGFMATIMVKEKDFQAALRVLGVAE